jgi:hypothetical protein
MVMSDATLLITCAAAGGALVGLLIAWVIDRTRRPRCTRCTEDCWQCRWPAVDDDTKWGE